MPEPFSPEWNEIGRKRDERIRNEGESRANTESYTKINKLREDLIQIRQALNCKTVMRGGMLGPYYGYPDDINDILAAIQKLKDNQK